TLLGVLRDDLLAGRGPPHRHAERLDPQPEPERREPLVAKLVHGVAVAGHGATIPAARPRYRLVPMRIEPRRAGPTRPRQPGSRDRRRRADLGATRQDRPADPGRLRCRHAEPRAGTAAGA